MLRTTSGSAASTLKYDPVEHRAEDFRRAFGTGLSAAGSGIGQLHAGRNVEHNDQMPVAAFGSFLWLEDFGIEQEEGEQSPREQTHAGNPKERRHPGPLT
jgi:hypothetical protein